jgi:hypothetical protein
MKIDWALTAAVTGVAVLAAGVSYTAYALLRSAPGPVKKPPSSISQTAQRRPNVPVESAPAPVSSAPIRVAAISPSTPTSFTLPNWDTLAPSQAPPPKPPPPAATPVRLTPPAEPVVGRPLAHPEQRKPVPAAAPANPRPWTPEPQYEPPKVDHRYDGVLTAAEIARFKNTLRMTPEQAPHWGPVETVLRDIGRQQIGQVNSGRKAQVEESALQRLYFAARPLIGVLRPEQKEHVRKLARSMGYAQYASMI